MPGSATAASSGGSAAAAQSAAAGRSVRSVRVRNLKSSKARIVNRGKKRTATIISFRLSKAARLVLVVRGPGPTCDVAARIRIRGSAGTNRVRFDGTARNRRLHPGTYLLTARVRGTETDLARTFVRIENPGSRRKAVKPRCSQPAPVASQPTNYAVASALGGFAAPSLPASDGSLPALEGATSANGSTTEVVGVLGALHLRGPESPLGAQKTQGAGLLPGPMAASSDTRSMIEVVLLATMVAALFGLAVALAADRRSSRRTRF